MIQNVQKVDPKKIASGMANVIKLTYPKNKDRAIIVLEKEKLPLGEMIQNGVQEKGAKAKIMVIDDYLVNQSSKKPEKALREIRKFEPTLTYFLGDLKERVPGFSGPVINELLNLGTRYASMLTFNDVIAGSEAMNADYDKVYERTHQVKEIVKNARIINVTNSNHTDMVVTLNPERLGWVASDGRIIRHGFPMNIPNGEVYGVPKSVEGIFTTTLLGANFTAKYGPLYDRPVTIELEKGYAVNVVCSDKELQKEFFGFIKRGRNTDRVGEFAIGTNENITRLIGYMLADEKALGVHIALGRPFKKSFKKGTPWKVKPDQHCDAIQQGSTVLVDGLMIMKDGKFII